MASGMLARSAWHPVMPSIRRLPPTSTRVHEHGPSGAEVVDILKEAATFISSSATATRLVEMLGFVAPDPPNCTRRPSSMLHRSAHQQAKDASYYMCTTLADNRVSELC